MPRCRSGGADVSWKVVVLDISLRSSYLPTVASVVATRTAGYSPVV